MNASSHAPAPDARRPIAPTDREAPDEVARMFEAARAERPALDVPLPAFAAFIGRHVARGKDATDPLRAADLLIACAYALGRPAAVEIVESEHMPRVRRALARIDVPGPAIADLQQDLRRRLLEMGDPSCARQGYSGRGDLGRWMVLCAVRQAGKGRHRDRRERSLEDEALAVLPSAGADPELDALLHAYKEPFQAAFREALGSLESRERNLLRLHFLHGHGIDEIGRVYGVHRATAHRWIRRAQEELADRTRARLLERIPISAAGVGGILEAIRSRLSVNLSGLLAESQVPPGAGRP